MGGAWREQGQLSFMLQDVPFRAVGAAFWPVLGHAFNSSRINFNGFRWIRGRIR